MTFTRKIVGRRCTWLVLTLALACGVRAAEDSGPPPPPESVQDTNAAQETMRSFLILQEQLHATRLAMERDRQEAAAAAAKNSEALAARLEAIERSLSSQRSNEMEAFRSSNRVMMTMACIFGAVGMAGLLLIAYSHWRSIHRLADLAATLPTSFGMRPGRAIAELQEGEARLLPTAATEQSSARLLDAMGKLEKRIHELEHTTTPGEVEVSNGADAPDKASNGGPHEAGEAADLLKQGQTLLDQDQAERALASFEQAMKLEPGNAEALVKKGAALERLRKPDEALKCYDEAIAANKSLTIAYLYKGGLFNRMERFNEALQCYELALRTQEKRGE
jgi:tetratricopeptide (TPR) repeat protein